MFCFGPTLPHQHLPIISHHPRLFFLSSPVFTKKIRSPNPTLRCSKIFYDMSHGFHPHHRINKTAPETAAPPLRLFQGKRWLSRHQGFVAPLLWVASNTSCVDQTLGCAMLFFALKTIKQWDIFWDIPGFPCVLSCNCILFVYFLFIMMILNVCHVSIMIPETKVTINMYSTTHSLKSVNGISNSCFFFDGFADLNMFLYVLVVSFLFKLWV